MSEVRRFALEAREKVGHYLLQPWESRFDKIRICSRHRITMEIELRGRKVVEKLRSATQQRCLFGFAMRDRGT